MKTIYAFGFYFLFRALYNNMIENESEFSVSLNIFFWVCWGIFLCWILINDILKEMNKYRISVYFIFIVVILFEIYLHLKSIGLSYEEYAAIINNPIQDKILFGAAAIAVSFISLKLIWRL